MLPDFESHHDRNSAIQWMATMSPMVRDSLDKELYRLTASSDMSTEEYILEDAFSNFLKDLGNMGLTVNLDTSDYPLELGLLFPFLHLSTYLFPTTLYPTLKARPSMRTLLRQIISGDVGDANASIVETYLSELAGLDGHPPLVPVELVDTIDQLVPYLSQTETFTAYIKHILQLLDQESLVPAQDVARMTQYQAITRVIIGRLSDAVNRFDTDPSYSDLQRIQQHCIQDLLNPTTLSDKMYLFLENPKTLPDELIDSHARRWYHYKVSSPWCPEYYAVRKIPVPDGYKAIFPAFVYATMFDAAQFDAIVHGWDTAYGNALLEATIRSLYQGG